MGRTSPRLQQRDMPSRGRQAVSTLPSSPAWIPAPSAPRDLPYFPLSPLPCKAPPFPAQDAEELKTWLVPRRQQASADPAHPLGD